MSQLLLAVLQSNDGSDEHVLSMTAACTVRMNDTDLLTVVDCDQVF